VDQPATSTILIRGSSQLVMDEAERSIHDALCVLRCLVKNKGIVSGGGAIEVEIAKHLESFA
jgi:T-complex protein 1 subunit delta